MKRTVRTDPYFDRQPPLAFLDELRAPVHTAPPAGFGKRSAAPGEVNVTGLWIDNRFPDPEGRLVSVIEDFDRFVCLCRAEGESFSIRLEEGPTPCFEAYSIRVSKAGIVVTAADTEGIRRALIWMEDEMRRREGPYLPLGKVERRPFIRSRITRSIFSAAADPAQSCDELEGDADHYPEEYLSRLMHDGTNGVWLRTRSDGQIEKLGQIIEKCARYGIRVFVETDGCEEDARRLFDRCPGLGGLISIDRSGQETSWVIREQTCEYGLWEPQDGSRVIATVPYVPVPGLLYRQYAEAREQGAAGVMQYADRGDYPSLMSKAAGALAFEESFDDEAGFLRGLAGICWGNSRADAVVKAWQLFEKGYRQYPADGLFSCSGPLHDAPVWELWLKPRPETADGDRIGASLLNGHTPEEALTLVGRMCTCWNAGLRVLDTLELVDEERQEQWSAAHAVGLLLESGRNVLELCRLRELLAHNVKPEVTLDSMRSIVEDEIRRSRMLAIMSAQDGRLGCHPGEGYRFFPEKLADRTEQLQELLKTEFPEVRARIEAGLSPFA